jgi:Tfp pilus assembly protein FimV
VSLAADTLEVHADLARALIEGGNREAGVHLLRQLETEAKRRYVSPVDLASIYVALGDHERALQLLEAALQKHNGSLLSLHFRPEFQPLRESPRFGRVLHAIESP